MGTIHWMREQTHNAIDATRKELEESQDETARLEKQLRQLEKETACEHPTEAVISENQSIMFHTDTCTLCGGSFTY